MLKHHFLVSILSLCAVARSVKPAEGDDTKIDAFGLEFSTHIKWIFFVAFIVIGTLTIIFITAKRFIEYE